MDWSPKAIELFFNDKEAERFAQDDSVNPKSSQKKQFRLEECLELYTTREKLGENDAWYVGYQTLAPQGISCFSSPLIFLLFYLQVLSNLQEASTGNKKIRHLVTTRPPGH